LKKSTKLEQILNQSLNN